MKSLKYLFFCSLVTVLAVSCHKLDPINVVIPGQDRQAPEIEITYPVPGKVVRSTDSVASITFELLATDDIELGSVVIQLDGTQIGSITSFLDYRRAVIEFPYNGLLDGDHTLVAVVTDLTGKDASATVAFKKITAPGYTPMDGEVVYMPFDGNYIDLISGNEATKTGSPGFTAGKLNDAYAGAADSYVQFPVSAVNSGTEFSVALWYKLNPDPARAGIISITPPNPNSDETRKNGFRFFRENSGTKMSFGINWGVGDVDIWMNPFMTIDPTSDWMHFAFSISATKATIYLNGAVLMEKDDVTGPIKWAGCTEITIASGQPNFVYWEHFSDLSNIDEMHFFTRAITAEDVQTLYSVKK